MIFLIYGTDSKKIQQKARIIAESLQKKKPDASIINIDKNNIEEDLDMTLGGSGLFENNYIVNIRNVSEDKDCWSIASKKIKKISESNHVFIWQENQKESASVKKIKTLAEKAEEHNADEEKIISPQAFDFLELFFNKKNKESWIWYINNNIDEIQLLNLIVWQIKSIKISSISNSASDAGLKPFVFSKAKKLSLIWEEKELTKLHLFCLDLQTRARSGENIKPDFEKNILCV